MFASIVALLPRFPDEVISAARFGGEVIHVRGKFLRVPILPNGADLYTRQVTQSPCAAMLRPPCGFPCFPTLPPRPQWRLDLLAAIKESGRFCAVRRHPSHPHMQPMNLT